jgi:hypothetical protein
LILRDCVVLAVVGAWDFAQQALSPVLLPEYLGTVLGNWQKS